MTTAADNVHVPWRERVNLRMILFFGLVLTLLGAPIYIYLESAITGGIKDVGGGLVEVDLKAMSTFSFDQTNGTIDDVPKKWRDLDGKRVTMVGEMWAPDAAGDTVSRFEMVYSISDCCFSGPPRVQHFVQSNVVTPKGVVPYVYGRPVRATGTLRVNVAKADGRVKSVYHLDVDRLQLAD